MVKEANCGEHRGDCEFVIRDENEEEIIDFVQQHAERAHGETVSPEDVQGMLKEV